VQSRSFSGGLPTAGDLTGGTAVSGDSFHSELEAALRRADVSPEGPDERRAVYEAADQSRRLDDSPREDVSRAREAAERNGKAQSTGEQSIAEQNAADRKVADRKAADEDARERNVQEKNVQDEKARDKNVKDPPEAKSPSEASRNRDDDAGSAKGESRTESEESAEGAEGDKRRRLFELRDTGRSIDEKSLQAAGITRTEGDVPKSRKLSPVLKSGGSLASEFGTPGAEAGTVENASRPGEPDKGTKPAGVAALRGVHGNGEAGEAAKGASASNLSVREIPRGTLDNGNRKGIRPEGEQDAQGDKDAGKNAIRTTVVSRGRNSGETDGSGGRHSALQDAPGRNDPSVVKETSDGPRFDTPSLDAARSGPASGNTSSLEGSRDVAPRHLHQQLKDFATGDVVRHARFVIKENAGGEIRLLLKPEQLGTVRVRLEVQDNRIAGRIIVENSTVRDAFEQTLSDLHRAFREAGLETGSLEVTVGEDGQASGRQQTAQGRRARAVEELAESVPTLIGELDEPRMINVYA
jgi:flagellar protein FlbC